MISELYAAGQTFAQKNCSDCGTQLRVVIRGAEYETTEIPPRPSRGEGRF